MQKLQVKTWDRFERFADAAHHSTLRITPEDLRTRWISHLPEAEQASLFAGLEDRSYVAFTDVHGRYNQLSKAPEPSASLLAAVAEDRAFEYARAAAEDTEAGLPYGWR